MSKRYLKFVSSTIALLIGLSGCSVLNPDFKDMSYAYSRTVENYNNDNILLNIVRASKSMPLGFLDIPSVIGTGSVNSTAGLSGTIFGAQPSSVAGFFSAAAQTGGSVVAGASSFTPSASLTVNRSFNFTQSSLDNAQFMTGFLKDLTPETIHFFAKRHIPPELLYTLVIGSIETELPNGERKVYVNNPQLPNYSEFQTMLYGLIDLGLSSEIVQIKQKFGPPMSGVDIEKTIAPIITLSKDGFILEALQVKGIERYQISKTMQAARICMIKNEKSNLVRELYTEAIFCTDPLQNQQAINSQPKTKNINDVSNKKLTTLNVKVRSTRNVFDFLGQVLNAQLSKEQPNMLMLRPTGPYSVGGNVSLPMFKVEKDATNTPAVASIEYGGNRYLIPKENAGYSNMVLDIASTLLTLNKIPGSIPASPAVLIR
jgi:hypothetical protein